MKEEFWRSIFNIADTMRENHPLSGNKAIIHLTYNQLRMIRHVYTLTLKKPNGIPLKTLAESLNITPAAASEMVMFLIKKDVLESEKNPEDMRSVLIRISRSIGDIIKDGEKMFRRKTADFLATIPPPRGAGNFDQTHQRILRLHHCQVTGQAVFPSAAPPSAANHKGA